MIGLAWLRPSTAQEALVQQGRLKSAVFAKGDTDFASYCIYLYDLLVLHG